LTDFSESVVSPYPVVIMPVSGTMSSAMCKKTQKSFGPPQTEPLPEVACWAHARRKFFDAQSSDIMRSMVMLAYPAVAGLLYDFEREAKEMKLNAEGRLTLRQASSVPILDDLLAGSWIAAQNTTHNLPA
jgi:hypothetical protein